MVGAVCLKGVDRTDNFAVHKSQKSDAEQNGTQQTAHLCHVTLKLA